DHRLGRGRRGYLADLVRSRRSRSLRCRRPNSLAARVRAQRPPRGPLSPPYTVTYPSGLLCYLSARSFIVPTYPPLTPHLPTLSPLTHTYPCSTYPCRRSGPVRSCDASNGRQADNPTAHRVLLLGRRD